jgi:hypothetical protein
MPDPWRASLREASEEPKQTLLEPSAGV